MSLLRWIICNCFNHGWFPTWRSGKNLLQQIAHSILIMSYSFIYSITSEIAENFPLDKIVKEIWKASKEMFNIWKLLLSHLQGKNTSGFWWCPTKEKNTLIRIWTSIEGEEFLFFTWRSTRYYGPWRRCWRRGKEHEFHVIKRNSIQLIKIAILPLLNKWSI